MLDVDHFKLYNDTYGHPSGDLVLQKLAEVLMGVTSRAGELAVRMGGEEFMMILPGSTSGDAMSTAEAVRERVAALKMLHASSPTGEFVSVSQGVVACVPGMNTEISDLIDAADKALYDSKDAGRNAITLSAYRP
jgi:diguanylate cyclase (GGDEF)-like protein